jgi:alkaline phosphatase
VPTLLELAKARGKATGAITTTELTHATPAATYSHICHRDAQYDIAAQAVPGGAGFNTALGDGVDVLMGGGRNHWTPFDATTNKKGRADGRNLLTEFAAKGYAVAATRDQMMQASGNKLIGLFSTTSHLEYEIDRVAGKGEGATQPSLADMTAKAIELLSKNSNGYFLMVEAAVSTTRCTAPTPSARWKTPSPSTTPSSARCRWSICRTRSSWSPPTTITR